MKSKLMQLFTRLFSSAALALTLTQATAQLIDITEKPDFSNPDFIYKTFLRDSTEKKFKGFYTNALAGLTTNYQYLNTFTRTDYNFARLLASYQINNFAFEAKGTFLNDNDFFIRGNESALGMGNLLKTNAQVVYYVLTPAVDETYVEGKRRDSVGTQLDPALRFRLGWNTENYFLADSTINRLVFDYESVGSFFEEVQLTGGYSLAWRLDEHDFIYAFYVRYGIFIDKRYDRKILYGVSICRQKLNRIDKWGSFKVEAGFSIAGLNVLYMFSRDIRRKFSNHELGVFINADFLSRLWLKSPKAKTYSELGN